MISTVASTSGFVGYKGWDKKLQFSDRQLHISDRGHYGCWKFQCCF